MNQDHVPDCRRCGTCCAKGGPALHAPDADLVARGVLSLADLRTHRPGEAVLDPVRNRVLRLETEVVVIAPARDDHGTFRGPACRFLVPAADRSPAACVIHDHAPLECRLLDCKAPQALMEAYDRDRLSRADLLPSGHALTRAVAYHQQAANLVRLGELVRAARTGKAHAARDLHREFSAMLAADRAARAALARDERSAAWLDFLLGWPLEELLPSLGLRLEQSADRERVLLR
jgi:Fe-S-cluster containining protein